MKDINDTLFHCSILYSHGYLNNNFRPIFKLFEIRNRKQNEEPKKSIFPEMSTTLYLFDI